MERRGVLPSKVYLKEQREEMSTHLLEEELALYSIHGIKNVGLMDILNNVGISKPFLYLNSLEPAAQIQTRVLAHYLASLCNH